MAEAKNPGTRIVTKIIFPTGDMESSISFYRSLGFTVESYDGGYAWVTNDGEEIVHLALATGLDRGANRAAGYFHVQDAAAWHRDWIASGIDVGPVQDQPWQMREFELIDPDGNKIRIGQNL